MEPLVTEVELASHLRTSLDEGDMLGIYVRAASEYVRAFTRQDWVDVTVPFSVKAATLLVAADLYENREAQQDVALYKNKTVEMLLWPYRAF